MNAVEVELQGETPSGLAELVAGLLEQNLAREPERVAHLRPSTVVLVAPDAGVAVTVRLSPGGVLVSDGVAPGADLRITARSERLLALAAAPLRGGLPDPLRRAGRAALADVVTARVRVRGLVRHHRRLVHFTSLLSVSAPAKERPGS